MNSPSFFLSLDPTSSSSAIDIAPLPLPLSLPSSLSSSLSSSPSKTPLDDRLEAASRLRESRIATISNRLTLSNKSVHSKVAETHNAESSKRSALAALHKDRLDRALLNRTSRFISERERLRNHHKKVSHLCSEARSPSRSPVRSPVSSPGVSTSPDLSPLGTSAFSRDLPPPLSLPKADHVRVEERLARARSKRDRSERQRRQEAAAALARVDRAAEKALDIKRRRAARARTHRLRVTHVCERVKGAKKLQTWVRQRKLLLDLRGAVQECEVLLNLFEKAEDEESAFEAATRKMMEPEVGKGGEKLAGILDSRQPNGGRTFLSSLLVASFPAYVLGDNYKEEQPSRNLAFVAKQVFKVVRAVGADDGHFGVQDSLRLATTNRVFADLFEQWREKDKRKLVADLEESAVQSWILFLESNAVLKAIEDAVEKDPDKAPKLAALKLRNTHGRTGSKKHLVRLRNSFNKILKSKDKGKEVMSACKKSAEEGLDLSAVKSGVLDEAAASAAASPKPAALTPPSSPSANLSDAKRIMANPKFVHRILATPKDALHEISLSGGGQRQETPSFEDVAGGAGGSSEPADIGSLMTKAFFDGLSSQINEHSNFSPFDGVVSELLSKIKSLLPNRADLHSELDRSEGLSRLSYLLKVGKLLSLIESVERAATTDAWIDMEREDEVFGDEKHLVASLRFLLIKADLCASDVADSKFHRMAPFIRANGVNYERSRFERCFGDFSSLCKDAEATKAWVRSIAAPSSSSSADRQRSIKEGVVSNLLFSRGSMQLPEVFLLDQEALMEARAVAKVSAIGTAIGIHCCAVAKAPVSSLTSDALLPAKNAVVTALTSHRVVVEEVAAAAQLLTNTLCTLAGSGLAPSWQSMVAGRVEAAIKNEDAIVKLMHKRVESFFSSSATKSFEAENAMPSSMTTGKTSSEQQEKQAEDDSWDREGQRMQEWAEQEAKRAGLGFFSQELAVEGAQLHFLVKNAMDVFSEVLLEPLLLEGQEKKGEEEDAMGVD